MGYMPKRGLDVNKCEIARYGSLDKETDQQFYGCSSGYYALMGTPLIHFSNV
jgi:hypothetical protein